MSPFMRYVVLTEMLILRVKDIGINIQSVKN